MKTIGLLGGMSWESTVPYYRAINQGIKAHLGGQHSAKIVLYSVDFHEIEACQLRGEWEKAGRILSRAALSLEKAGAECILLCTNTMHKVVPQIEKACQLPLLHIADATGQEISTSRYRQVALLGTRYTMEQDFYRGRLKENFGITSIIPDEKQRLEVNRIIFDELCQGIINLASRHFYQEVIEELQDLGAEAVIFGCTEIGLLLGQSDCLLPVFDTTEIHARYAVNYMLNGY